MTRRIDKLNATTGRPEFVTLPGARYDCAFCSQTLQPPVKQTSCGHRMCAMCVDNLFSSDVITECPGNEDDCDMLDKTRVGLVRKP